MAARCSLCNFETFISHTSRSLAIWPVLYLILLQSLAPWCNDICDFMWPSKIPNYIPFQKIFELNYFICKIVKLRNLDRFTTLCFDENKIALNILCLIMITIMQTVLDCPHISWMHFVVGILFSPGANFSS